MKRFFLVAATVLLALNLLGGCSKPQPESPGVTEPSASLTEPAITPPVDTTPQKPGDDVQNEGNVSADSVDTPYAQQIERYYTAMSNQWDENTYFENEMSPMAVYYYEGNALDNVGFALLDLDRDDIQELVIGAIMNAEKDPLVFEIWTLKDGQPVMLAQSGAHNRYYLQYAKDDNLWSIAYEAENGAANHAVYYLNLSDGEFQVIQGILFDAMANENAPWFMAYDLDWDISNDIPIDEDTANAVMEAERNLYTNMEYIPYSQYK